FPAEKAARQALISYVASLPAIEALEQAAEDTQELAYILEDMSDDLIWEVAKLDARVNEHESLTSEESAKLAAMLAFFGAPAKDNVELAQVMDWQALYNDALEILADTLHYGDVLTQAPEVEALTISFEQVPYTPDQSFFYGTFAGATVLIWQEREGY